MICKECKATVDGEFPAMQQHWSSAHSHKYKVLTSKFDEDLAHSHATNWEPAKRGPDYSTVDVVRFSKRHSGPIQTEDS